MMALLTGRVSGRAWVVWRVEWHIFRQLWFSRLAWTFGEPLLYSVLFGVGFKPFIPEMSGMTYLQFLAPGLLIAYIMYASSFECTYNTYNHLSSEQWFDALLASPLTPEDVAGGTILWGTTRGLFIGIGMTVFCLATGSMRSGLGLMVLPISLLTGVVFSAIGVWLCAYVKSYDHFNYLWGFYITPAVLVAGVYFPLEQMPGWLQVAARFFPATYGLHPLRHAFQGVWTWSDTGQVAVLALLAWGLWHGAVRALSKRLVT